MSAISRAAIYQFERLATARDRMPMATATAGSVYSSFVSAVPKAATWWWTNERGDLRLFRSNPINVLQNLQEWAGAPIDRYWGSQTRTRLMQYAGLSDAPSAPVPMRTLLEAALARALEGQGFGPGTVVIPQLATFPPLNAPRGTFVGGVVASGDNLLYWDGSRGAFRATEAPPVADVPPTPVAPTPTPVEPVRDVPPAIGRISFVVRVVNIPSGGRLTLDEIAPPAPLRLVEQSRMTTSQSFVVDGPDGQQFPLVFRVRISDDPPLVSNPIDFTWRAATPQSVELEFDVATSRLSVVRSTPVDGGGAVVQQAGILGGSPVVAVAVVAVLMGSLYLWDRSRPANKRIFRPL